MSKIKLHLITLMTICVFTSNLVNAECNNHEQFIKDAKKVNFNMYANIDLLEKTLNEDLTQDEYKNVNYFKVQEKLVKQQLSELVNIASKYESLKPTNKKLAIDILNKNAKDLLSYLDILLSDFYDPKKMSTRPIVKLPLTMTHDNFLETNALIANYCPTSFLEINSEK